MEGKAFRGEAGQVVRGFLSVGTWFTAVPVGLATVLLAVLAGFMQERLALPATVAVPAFLTLLAPVTGLFAMSARTGRLDAGLLESLAGEGGRRTAGFTLRYGALQVAWSVPLVMAAQALVARGGAAFMSGPGTAMTLAIWGVVALAAACVVLPTLTLLVATRTDTVGEAFSPGAWRWLLVSRGADVVPCMAAAIGGMTLFLLVALPPLAVVLPLAADMSPQFAQGLLVALPMLPWATTPILLGRLAGAFVAAEPLVEEPAAARPASRPSAPTASSTFDVPVPSASRTVASLAGMPGSGAGMARMDCPTSVQAAKGSLGVPLGVALARAHQLADTNLEAAVAELESLREANPRNPAVVAEFARVLKKAGRTEEAITAAAHAIRLALTGGAGPIAHDVFRSFAPEAAQLNLEPAVYEQLGRILTARREYDGASWCYRAAAALGGDPKSLQKGLLGVAEAAMEHGQFERAAGVYQAFARTWPESPLARFATDGADEALRKAQLTGTAR